MAKKDGKGGHDWGAPHIPVAQWRGFSAAEEVQPARRWWFPFLKREIASAGAAGLFFERQHLYPQGRGVVPGGRAEFFFTTDAGRPAAGAENFSAFNTFSRYLCSFSR